MADDDFDLEGLAAYLHLDPAQVRKLVERGKIPGRRVAGAWRFSRPEIHVWLEERIGLSSEDELVRVEGFLSQEAGEPQLEPVSIAELLPIEAIEIPLAAKTRSSVIHAMVEVAARTGWLWDPERMEEAVRLREEMHTTAIDSGVALLHPRRSMPSILDRPFVALGRTDHAIPFGGTRGIMTDVFFLICSADDRGHLRMLARLSRMLMAPDFLAELRRAGDAHEAHALIAARDVAFEA